MNHVSTRCLRTLAFKLNPLGMSSDLIKQLQAVILKLEHCGQQLQNLIHLKKNKNKHYQKVNEEVPLHETSRVATGQVDELIELAQKRIQLGKALIRASEPKAKAKCKKAASEEGAKTETA